MGGYFRLLKLIYLLGFLKYRKHILKNWFAVKVIKFYFNLTVPPRLPKWRVCLRDDMFKVT